MGKQPITHTAGGKTAHYTHSRRDQAALPLPMQPPTCSTQQELLDQWSAHQKHKCTATPKLSKQHATPLFLYSRNIQRLPVSVIVIHHVASSSITCMCCWVCTEKNALSYESYRREACGAVKVKSSSPCQVLTSQWAVTGHMRAV